jgi:hypothetical protein
MDCERRFGQKGGAKASYGERTKLPERAIVDESTHYDERANTT